MKPQRLTVGASMALCLAVCTNAAHAFDPNNPIPAPIEKGNIVIELQSIAQVASPTFLTHAGDGSGRLFVTQQPGQIGIIDNGALLPTPFLDVSSRMPSLGLFGPLDFDERGLLGLAFHPNFSSNGKFYTFTSELIDGPADFTVADLPPLDPASERHQSVVAEWQVDLQNPNVANPASRRELLRIDNPQFNHNAGALTFGSGTDLFIAVGDGGASNDNAPGHGDDGNGQDPRNVLGTVLRIDVEGNNSANGQYGIPQAAPFSTFPTDPTDSIPDEIYAYGFRNPFRMSFDSETGSLIVADVGQGDIEEVDIVTAGGNFGWRFKEGSFAFQFDESGNPSVTDDLTGIPPGLIDPVLEYDHDEGISIIGGFIYRGSAIPELAGKYVFGDFTNSGFQTPGGRLFYGDLDTGLIQEFIIGLDDRALGLFVKGFGIDEAGELYVLADLSLSANSTVGQVLKIVAAPIPLPAALWLFMPACGAVLARRRTRRLVSRSNPA